MTELTYISQQGHVKMVDVLDKQITKRAVVVHSSITINETTFKQISNNTNTRGNVLNTAQTAGIMAAKNASVLIPMYHPLPLTGIDVHSSRDETSTPFYVSNTQTIVPTTGKTGVEMEALTVASAAALTVYDMAKVVGKGMIISETYLESRSGGKSGDFQRQSNQ